MESDQAEAFRVLKCYYTTKSQICFCRWLKKKSFSGGKSLYSIATPIGACRNLDKKLEAFLTDRIQILAKCISLVTYWILRSKCCFNLTWVVSYVRLCVTKIVDGLHLSISWPNDNKITTFKAGKCVDNEAG